MLSMTLFLKLGFTGFRDRSAFLRPRRDAQILDPIAQSVAAPDV